MSRRLLTAAGVFLVAAFLIVSCAIELAQAPPSVTRFTIGGGR